MRGPIGSLQVVVLSGNCGPCCHQKNTTQHDNEDDHLANSDLLNILDGLVEKARSRGLEKLDEHRAKTLAVSLQGGTSQAHRAANVDNALPPLRLIIQLQPEPGAQTSEYISDPLKVAAHHAKPLRGLEV